MARRGGAIDGSESVHFVVATVPFPLPHPAAARASIQSAGAILDPPTLLESEAWGQGSADAADMMVQQALYALEYSWEVSAHLHACSLCSVLALLLLVLFCVLLDLFGCSS